MKFKDEQLYKQSAGIYCIKNLINGKCYVGQTTQTFIRRYWHHQWCLNERQHFNKYLQNAWNKYGADAFEFSVLHVWESHTEDIDVLEQRYIIQLDSLNNGYNMQQGGQPTTLHLLISEESRKIAGAKNREHMLGRKLSDETRAKMRASSPHRKLTADDRQRISNYMSNRIVSEITKEKLRIANTGSNSPVTHLVEADVFDIKCQLMAGVIQKRLAEKYDVSIGAISAIANGRTWKHVEVPGWEMYLLNKNKKVV